MTGRGAYLCVVALLAAACGTATSRSRATPHPPAIASLDGCIRVSGSARKVVVRPASGAPLNAALIGRGSTAFVLTDESDENLCSWLPFVARLRAHGYPALLYDYSDVTELPGQVTAAARAALHAGAEHVVLMGASVGARASIEAAGAHPPGVIAVVSLSAEQWVRSDPTDLAAVARRVKAPTLLISSRADPFVAGFTPQLLRRLGAGDKQALILPGLDHGTAVLTDSYGPRVRAAILSFIAHLPRIQRTS
jgi:pimeloyl-ACP methyl ester carboxylesterase